MSLLYHVNMYLEFLILACTIYILASKKLKCRLCEKYYNDEDMSEEHYPAHSVGNDDIIALDFTKLMDTLMGDNQEFKKIMNDAIDSGYNLMEL